MHFARQVQATKPTYRDQLQSRELRASDLLACGWAYGWLTGGLRSVSYLCCVTTLHLGPRKSLPFTRFLRGPRHFLPLCRSATQSYCSNVAFVETSPNRDRKESIFNSNRAYCSRLKRNGKIKTRETMDPTVGNLRKYKFG